MFGIVLLKISQISPLSEKDERNITHKGHSAEMQGGAQPSRYEELRRLRKRQGRGGHKGATLSFVPRPLWRRGAAAVPTGARLVHPPWCLEARASSRQRCRHAAGHSPRARCSRHLPPLSAHALFAVPRIRNAHGMYVCRKAKNSQARTGHQRGMGGRWTDDDDTHERHIDTNKLTRHTASGLPHTLSGRTHHSGPRPPCRPPSTHGAKGSNNSTQTQAGDRE